MNKQLTMSGGEQLTAVSCHASTMYESMGEWTMQTVFKEQEPVVKVIGVKKFI